MKPHVLLSGVIGIAAGCGSVGEPRDVVCGPSPVEVLVNGNFDAATPPWVQEPAAPSLLCTQAIITPNTLPNTACLGLMDGVVQTMSQTIKLPEGATTVTLSGQMCIATNETALVDRDTLQFELLTGDTVIATLGSRSNRNGAANCQFAPFMLTAPLTADPETATLRIRATLDTDRPTTFYVDSLSLQAECKK